MHDHDLTGSCYSATIEKVIKFFSRKRHMKLKCNAEKSIALYDNVVRVTLEYVGGTPSSYGGNSKIHIAR